MSNDKTQPQALPPAQIAMAVMLGLVFLFCVVRTIMALRGSPTAAQQRQAAPSSPAPLVLVPTEAQPAPTETPADDAGGEAQETSHAGAALLAGELPPDLAVGDESDAAYDEPDPSATPHKPVQVAKAEPSPSPSPEEEATPSPTPAPEETPVPSPSPVTVTVNGSVSRPGGPSGMAPLRNHVVTLVDFGDAQSQQAVTDDEGRYTFSGLKPGNLYYVVATYEENIQIGHHYEYSYGAGYNGGMGNRQVPTTVNTQFSWHQAIIAPPPGTYGLELNPGNADPEYCADVRPTNDPITRTPYRSWRRSNLQGQ